MLIFRDRPRNARILAALALLGASQLTAQSPEGRVDAAPNYSLPQLGSRLEDQLRVRQILGLSSTAGFLARTLSSQLPELPENEARWAILGPSLEGVWNSQIPFSLNQGPMWAGRGVSGMLTAGVRFAWGPVDLLVVPQLTYAQNREFDTIPPRDKERSQFASPWYIRSQSADLPLRFGDAPLGILHPGQTSLTVRWGGARFGAATENEWWGPGIRNAIVMSNHAEGIPRVFMATDSPIDTRIGTFEARWILGGLTESLHFDADPGNDLRSLSGAVATYAPRWDPNLTLGLSRVVYSAVSGSSAVPAHALDVLTWWKNQVLEPDSTIQNTTELQTLRDELPELYDREQITALFGRWILPADGLEIYVEWARTALPSSFAELLTEPHHSQGYSLGLQWVRPLRNANQIRLQTEVTYLEESSSYDNRAVPSFYVSGAVEQGYTQRGRTVGAAIGPGGSSQWLASDYLAEKWNLGIVAGRIRWNNDVYYRGVDRREVGHDVSLFGGIRSGGEMLGTEFRAEFLWQNRFNYLFQNPALEPEGTHAVDMPNASIRLTVSRVY